MKWIQRRAPRKQKANEIYNILPQIVWQHCCTEATAQKVTKQSLLALRTGLKKELRRKGTQKKEKGQ